MWGDSGLYYCIITTPDDLEGKNEDSVELLVLGEWRREHLSRWLVPLLGPRPCTQPLSLHSDRALWVSG